MFADYQLQKVVHIQSLWSGYGEIARYHSGLLDSPVIVKHVTPPNAVNHPRGWHSDVGHQRKLSSYQNEKAFYARYAANCSESCYVPECHAVEQDGEQVFLLLEDLDATGFSGRRKVASYKEITLCVQWLAHFHARFLTIDTTDLWPVGCYWHLATRRDEYDSMEKGALKDAAAFLDQALNNTCYQTLLHGDAKLANFCFSADSTRVAAVDFQYTGRGPGIKDLAYLLGSCLDDQGLQSCEQSLCDQYFLTLKQTLSEAAGSPDFQQLESQWRSLYSIAWADFYRFLSGWSPDHFKINLHMQRHTQKAFEILGL